MFFPAWALLVIVVILAVGERAYHVNDDYGMEALVNGDYTGSPDERTVFFGSALGYPLSWFYNFFPGIPWFGLMLYTALGAGIVVLAVVLHRNRDAIGYPNTIVVAACGLAIFPRFLLSLSFTTVSATLSLAAVVATMKYASNRGSSFGRSSGIAAFCAAFIAVTIRFDAALVPIVLAVPFLLWPNLKRVGALLIVGCGALLGLGMTWVIKTFLADGGYRRYLEYNAVRGQLHDTPRLNSSVMTGERLQDVGWSSLDLEAFRGFIFDDREKFSLAAIEKVLAMTKGTRNNFSFEMISNVVFAYPMLLTAFVGIVIVHLLSGRKALAVLSVTTGLLAVALMMWLSLNLRLPERVALPMWLSVCVISGVSSMLTGNAGEESGRPEIRSKERWLTNTSIGLGAAVVGLVWIGAIGPFATSRQNEIHKTQLKEQLELIDSAAPNEVVLAGGLLTTEGKDPLQANGPLNDRRILTFGWPIFSPMYETRKEVLGVDEPMTDVLRRPGLVWYGSYGVELIGRYLRQEFDLNDLPGNGLTLFKPRDCLSDGSACIWQVEPTIAEIVANGWP